MIRRTPVASRPAVVLGVVACVAAALALTPAKAAACPNEQLRGESRVNPVTGQPYARSLPDCRAYEMVSPSYKASHDAVWVGNNGVPALPVAPDGQAAGFTSPGGFADPEAQVGGTEVFNFYTAQRGASGWLTASAFPPVKVIPFPGSEGLSSDFSPDLRSNQAACGAAPLGTFESRRFGLLCARKLAGAWVATLPPYQAAEIGRDEPSLNYLGASSDLSRVFVSPTFPLRPEDTVARLSGIYEIAGLGGPSPQLRLVNVDSEGRELVTSFEGGTPGVCGVACPPTLGDARNYGHIRGTAYHAISDSGRTVFFGADAKGTQREEETLALYARIHCAEGSPSPCKEYPKGSTEYFETVEVSECTSGCAASEKSLPAVFEGASADGSKVFFTTERALLSSDKNGALDLYEYDLGKRRLKLLSGGESGTEVTGVVRTSSDGSHVYFTMRGVLSGAESENTWYDEAGIKHDKALSGTENLYGYDANTGKIKFVANASTAGTYGFLGIRGPHVGPRGLESTDLERHAQTTPDGRYLVFSSPGALAGSTNNPKKEAVYRYDFEKGELTWISQAAPSVRAENGGKNPAMAQDAIIAPLPGTVSGAAADADAWNRAISGCPKGASAQEGKQCPEGKYDGEYIIFTTSERLQANDVNNAPDVYEWHNGTVSMISDGRDSTTAELAGKLGPGVQGWAMSASGSDIFFFTHAPLVGQDTDVLLDIYDARMNREGGQPLESGKELAGFPAPPVERSCSGEACQGGPLAPPVFGTSASSVFPASGNLSLRRGGSPGGGSLGHSESNAGKLAKALKACKAKPRKKRAACEAQARKKYGGKAKAKKKARTRSGNRRGS